MNCFGSTFYREEGIVEQDEEERAAWAYQEEAEKAPCRFSLRPLQHDAEETVEELLQLRLPLLHEARVGAAEEALGREVRHSAQPFGHLRMELWMEKDEVRCGDEVMRKEVAFTGEFSEPTGDGGEPCAVPVSLHSVFDVVGYQLVVGDEDADAVALLRHRSSQSLYQLSCQRQRMLTGVSSLCRYKTVGLTSSVARFTIWRS